MSRVTGAKSLLVLPFVLLLLLLAAYPALAAPEPAGWYQQPSGTTGDIYCLSAVSPTVAWALSDQGVIRTADGGNNWARTLGQPVLGPIAAVDANTAWAVGSNFTISRTTDGGATWTQQYAGQPSIHWESIATGVCAVDANNVWVCGYTVFWDTPPYGVHAVVTRTSDGGLNWTQVSFGNNGSMNFGISALDANTAWTCGSDTSTNCPIMKTVDGGTTWVPQANGITSTLMTGISAVDANHAFAVGATPSTNPAHSYILKTSDGSNWSSIDMGTDYRVAGVKAVGPETAWVVATGGTILKTSDGTNWAAQQSWTTADLAAVSAVDTNIAWAAGAGGTILHTVDGGTGIPVCSITSVTPNTGVAGWPVSVTNLAGAGFREGATVRLEDGGTVVNATNVKVISDTQITCDFGLPGALGKYDVVVKNQVGPEARLTKGFSVTNICGQGAGTIALGFGLIMGIMALGGSGFVRRRRGRKSR
jgi:photosystem II stability/assembly factor-like uncharacterized protein